MLLYPAVTSQLEQRHSTLQFDSNFGYIVDKVILSEGPFSKVYFISITKAESISFKTILTQKGTEDYAVNFKARPVNNIFKFHSI